MVFFNDPLAQPDHAERAVRMALHMRDQLDLLCRGLAQAALSEITAGIGISTGFVTVGNFGSPIRIDYTVIDNHVNLVSRLADDAAPGEILISERTLALQPRDLVTVTNHHRPQYSESLRPLRIPGALDTRTTLCAGLVRIGCGSMSDWVFESYGVLWGELMFVMHDADHLRDVNRGRADWFASLDLPGLRVLDWVLATATSTWSSVGVATGS